MKILFVCSGNSCRSVMAEYYARNKAAQLGMTDVEFSSAGTSAFDGAPPCIDALQMLIEDGIDGSRHKARLLRPEILARTDLSLCMTLCHIDEVRAIWGAWGAGRIMLLGEVSSPHIQISAEGRISGLDLDSGYRRQLEVEDPINRGIEFYQFIYGQLKGFIDKLLAILKTG